MGAGPNSKDLRPMVENQSGRRELNWEGKPGYRWRPGSYIFGDPVGYGTVELGLIDKIPL